jgi:hypothetical protein
MLVAVHPNPATSFPLDRAFAAGQGTVSVGRVEHNVISAINLNSNASQTLPEKLINMVGAAPRPAGGAPVRGRRRAPGVSAAAVGWLVATAPPAVCLLRLIIWLWLMPAWPS